jgi:hypothetical protein
VKCVLLLLLSLGALADKPRVNGCAGPLKMKLTRGEKV